MFDDCPPSSLTHARGVLLNVRGTHHVVGYFDTHFGVDMLPNMRWSGRAASSALVDQRESMIQNKVASIGRLLPRAAQLGR
jgi:hypothetical protein